MSLIQHGLGNHCSGRRQKTIKARVGSREVQVVESEQLGCKDLVLVSETEKSRFKSRTDSEQARVESVEMKRVEVEAWIPRRSRKV